MQTPSWIYPKINIATILTVLGVGWYVSSYVKDLETGLAEQQRATESIRESVAPLTTIPLRVQNLEAADAVINNRLDRLGDTIIEALRKDISDVSVKVEVQSNKIDTLNDKVDRLSNGTRPSDRSRLHVLPWAYTPYQREAQKTAPTISPAP